MHETTTKSSSTIIADIIMSQYLDSRSDMRYAAACVDMLQKLNEIRLNLIYYSKYAALTL